MLRALLFTTSLTTLSIAAIACGDSNPDVADASTADASVLDAGSDDAAIPGRLLRQQNLSTTIPRVAVGVDDNVTISGNFAETVDFGGGPLTAPEDDVFVARFSGGGDHLASGGFGGPERQVVAAMGIDATHNVTIGGAYEGSPDFGGGAFPTAPDDTFLGFVASYSPSASHRWSIPLTSATTVAVRAIATAPDGTTYAMASFTNAVTVSGTTVEAVGGDDVLLVKFDSNGELLDARRLAGTGDEEVGSATIDASGNLYITGRFSDAITFGSQTLVNSGGIDSFVAKFSPAGVAEWAIALGGDDNLDSTLAPHVSVGVGGNLVLAGDFFGTTAVADGANLASVGARDIYLATVSPLGVVIQAQSFGSTAAESITGLAVGPGGELGLVGEFSLTLSLGGDELSGVGTNLFFAVFEEDGGHRWSRGAGSGGTNEGRTAAFAPDGSFYATVSFTGSVDFGGPEPLLSESGRDGALLKYAP